MIIINLKNNGRTPTLVKDFATTTIHLDVQTAADIMELVMAIGTVRRSRSMTRDTCGIDSDSVPLTAAPPTTATKEWTMNSEALFEGVIRIFLHSANVTETDLNVRHRRQLVVKSGRMIDATQTMVVKSSQLATIECPLETKEIDTMLTSNHRHSPNIGRQVVAMTVYRTKLASVIATMRRLQETIGENRLREMIVEYRLQETIGDYHLREMIDDIHLHLEVKLLLLIFVFIKVPFSNV